MSMIYPWQQKQWRQLQKSLEDGRFPHALLLIGQEGMGKLDFAQNIAYHLLMQDSPESGSLLTVGNHPDYFHIQPLEGKKIIGVDQIRHLQKKLQQKSHVSQYQVAIIAPADAMNIASSNALLKTLEEPGQNTIIILVSSHPQQLPATIRSRCQVLSFSQVHDRETIHWLQQQLLEGQDAELLLNLAHGAPLAALSMSDGDIQLQRKMVFKGFAGLIREQKDPVEVANQWQKYEVWQVLSWLQTWLLDISRIQAGAGLVVLNPKYQQAIKDLSEHLEKAAVFDWIDQLSALKKQLAQVSQINIQLALEDLLIGMHYGRSHR